jgi:hypothetical protein
MGLQIRSGPWSPDDIRSFLTDAHIPIRLATSGSAGPLVQSLWFAPIGDELWCCTQVNSVLMKRVARDPRVGFEISGDQPPYRGVRGSAHASSHPDEAPNILPLLISRYLDDPDAPLAKWLTSRLPNETAIRLNDLQVSTWDYSQRM